MRARGSIHLVSFVGVDGPEIVSVGLPCCFTFLEGLSTVVFFLLGIVRQIVKLTQDQVA